MGRDPFHHEHSGESTQVLSGCARRTRAAGRRRHMSGDRAGNSVAEHTSGIKGPQALQRVDPHWRAMSATGLDPSSEMPAAATVERFPTDQRAVLATSTRSISSTQLSRRRSAPRNSSAVPYPQSTPMLHMPFARAPAISPTRSPILKLAQVLGHELGDAIDVLGLRHELLRDPGGSP